ncbi:Cyclic nucleotide-gated ion channel 4 [Dendrobium catenatum]|uniref:Cyclic nucleotide-gated ion channel 4 n=1 Tax=Dendrobium catenatum TaxID=906689 RepID=A0A2I0VHM3_9ASPA|nr:Cyclic nucleotide-gated ion channel 4 [Dendrobium catenatum]
MDCLSRHQHKPPGENSSSHFLGLNDSQHIWKPGEHNGMAGDRLQHHHNNIWSRLGHHVDWKHKGYGSSSNVFDEMSTEAIVLVYYSLQVFLHATTSKKQALHLRMRSVEWWMKRKNLPQGFRHRVRQYERQRWAAMRGVDECEMVRNLPEGLRRDIKYHLCLDLVRQV